MALQGTWLKIDRACEHLEAFEDALPDFRKRDPCHWADETDPNTGDKIWRVQGRPLDPPVEWNVIIGDALYNFRSALDHLAWQLVLANGNTPTRHTAFPICTSASLYAQSSPRKVKRMSKTAIALIEETQPCFGRNPHRNKLLAWLDGLHNVDKHRHLNLTVAATIGGLWFPGLPVVAHEEVFIYEGPVEDGTELARVPQKYAYVQFAPATDVAFGDGTPASGESVFAVLIGIRELLISLGVVSQFHQFFR
jgi:hypothetical protein